MDRIVRERECRELTVLSRLTRTRMIKRGEFPPKRRISPKFSGWLESDLEKWLTNLEDKNGRLP